MINGDVANPTRHPTPIPPGQNLVNLIRKGMALNLPSTNQTAKEVGLSQRTYRLGRKLLLLVDRGVLSDDEVALAYRAVELIQQTKALSASQELAAGLLSKYWDDGTHSGKHRRGTPLRVATKQLKRFDNTLFAIREATSNNEEMVIPELTMVDRRNAESLLIESIHDLSQLLMRVRFNVETPSE